MKEKIEAVRMAAKSAFAAAADLAAADHAKNKYLGRKGEVAALFKLMPSVDPAERGEAGKLLNELRQELEAVCEAKLNSLQPRSQAASIDTTLPGRDYFIGSYHPLTVVMREIIDIFRGMGYRVADGPELELVKYNFDMLNTPEWHPSRDESDTIYLPNGFVVRTETSPVQIRTMEKMQPPVRIISPGRVYRRDRPDATHSPMFHQCEGLYVDEGVTMADLKGTLLSFYRQLFGQDTNIRFRPHFFPFTEPSAEVDVTCPFCHGKGCRVCKQTGWLEMGGSGMVDPNVLEGVGYDIEKYTGFAFGLGIDRMAMLRFGMDNIRLLFDSDVRFLRQFAGMQPK
ncbi:phenylalanine--tRNA ligase subunit alpha [bacterium]|nr:MAG: phenylalanine--tRNA ligase subunit alpha [bacterium]